MIHAEIDRLALRIQKLLDVGWRSVKVVTDHGWLFCPDGLSTAELPKHLTASKWARCAAIKGESQVPVPTVAWSWNPSEQFATPNGAACFNTGSTNSYAHGGISLQECLTPVLLVSGRAGGTRLLVEDDELEGAVVVAVLISPDGRVIAQRCTVVGGEA